MVRVARACAFQSNTGLRLLRQAGHALKLQHKAKRFNHIVHIAALPPAGLAHAFIPLLAGRRREEKR